MSVNYGVIVGRFQVPELHDGHMELFRQVRLRHQRIIVFLGCSATKSASRNYPLDFDVRRRMIQAKFPELIILPLEDKRTDEEWSNNLDNEIKKVVDFGFITLYGARDSFVPHYTGKHTPIELALTTTNPSGTAIREALTNTVMESYDFRAGIIHAVNNMRPRLFTTVDIAILHKGWMPTNRMGEVAQTFLLLGKKPGFDRWRFIGGFAEPKSYTFEADARREVREETGLDVANLHYITSTGIPDWRYAKSVDCIRTLFFAAWSPTLGGTAADDISELRWWNTKYISTDDMVSEHVTLMQCLMNYLGAIEKENAIEPVAQHG